MAELGSASERRGAALAHRAVSVFAALLQSHCGVIVTEQSKMPPPGFTHRLHRLVSATTAKFRWLAT